MKKMININRTEGGTPCLWVGRVKPNKVMMVLNKRTGQLPDGIGCSGDFYLVDINVLDSVVVEVDMGERLIYSFYRFTGPLEDLYMAEVEEMEFDLPKVPQELVRKIESGSFDGLDFVR